jgi:hypothetical protein
MDDDEESFYLCELNCAWENYMYYDMYMFRLLKEVDGVYYMVFMSHNFTKTT